MAVFILVRKLADYFDRISDALTTFRLLLYILLSYLAVSLVLALEHRFSFSALQLLVSFIVLISVSKLANLGLANLFKVPANHESDIITGLILVFILTPAANLNQLLVLAAAATIAMVSKYALSLRGRHLLNPAAFGAFIAGVAFHQYASWWIGGQVMAPILLIGGLLIIRKMRRFQLTLSFAAIYIAYQWVLAPAIFGQTVPTLHLLYLDLVSTPLLFFAPIMLTEPLTSPTKENNLLLFSLVVAFFYCVTKLQRPPEEALLLGNIFAFVLEPNHNLLLKFKGARQDAVGIFSFVFSAPARFKFQAGQYMEWTLPRTGIDARGNRRYLTIASSPTEDNLMFTVKIPEHHSKFKNALLALKPGQTVAATRLAGSFTIKSDTSKIVFIAGGVGITPFRSIIKDLVDKSAKRDIHLFYSVNTAAEIAFKDLFDEAATIGVQTSYITTKGTEPEYLHGAVDANFIKTNLADYLERTYYISGPQGFVAAVRLALLELGVNAGNITTDFFPGYN